MVTLAILCWATLAALVAVFLRMAMRPDAGFGAGGAGRSRRTGSPARRTRPTISPPNDAAWAALRR